MAKLARMVVRARCRRRVQRQRLATRRRRIKDGTRGPDFRTLFAREFGKRPFMVLSYRGAFKAVGREEG